METAKLKKFAQYARRTLQDLVEAKLQLVLHVGSAARREAAQAVVELEREMTQTSREHIVEKVAYTWFNRFCALRFMDVNGYTRIRVVSPADEGQFQPEILAEAKMGNIDDERVPDKVRQQVTALLDGTATSSDPQQEAYRLLVVAECNSFYRAMPYLFERIADYTELLMPDDLLSGNSILAAAREAMTVDACQDVEVIGWLYQFYISEKKDAVFDGLKKGRKISPENIPAATQLFTPHWIVRYLVENSLGRLWMLNHPNSGLIEQMDYYIKPETVETDFLRIARPEDIKVCDPACGSGHMLTYAFDLLYAMYEEAGTDASEIPEKILTHNLYGIELDERAGDLAAFALTMKARAKQRRFFNKSIEPNICVLEKISFSNGELDEYMDVVGCDLFTLDLRATLQQFDEADNFGSLIRPKLRNVQNMLPLLAAKDMGGQLFLKCTHDKVIHVLRQTDYLSSKYQVVVANPPYMGSKGMNSRLSAWAKKNYPDSKSDLFAMFIERNLDFVVKQGSVGMITMQSWMFLSSYEKLRASMLEHDTILTMAHLGSRAFDSIGGEVVSTTAFVLKNVPYRDLQGDFLRLVDGSSEAEKDRMLREAVRNRNCVWYHRAASNDFHKIPGSPIAYWVSKKVRDIFETEPSLGDIAEAKQGLGTGQDAVFFRFFWEICQVKMGFDFTSSIDIWNGEKKWIPLNKGGSFRKWYGNKEYLIAFNKENRDILKKLGNNLPSEHKYLKPFISWSDITSANNSFRKFEHGFLFSNTGHCVFPEGFDQESILLSYCNNKFVNMMTKILNPTIHFHVGYFNLLPYPSKITKENTKIRKLTDLLVGEAKSDWDSFETSWNFEEYSLLKKNIYQPTLKKTYIKIRTSWNESILTVQRLEEENNRIFIDAYELQDELEPDVSLNEITLTCNPHYRYGNKKTESEMESLLLADTMSEFISYAVGCMFGRYSLDQPGLVLANQGDTMADYLRRVPQPRFMPDDDNLIPMLDGEWFSDDITERFRAFLRVTFGDEHYVENMQFIEDALGKDIRKYFLKDFYSDHVKRYKKRPIYWLFASPKGTFSALIYLHRYRPDTASVVLQCLRDFVVKLGAHRTYLDQISIDPGAGQVEKTRALKEIDSLKKQLLELDEYERETLYPLATSQIALDLDDGVKVNYLKLGAALKKIVGLDAKDDE